jgi:hypothetical protein
MNTHSKNKYLKKSTYRLYYLFSILLLIFIPISVNQFNINDPLIQNNYSSNELRTASVTEILFQGNEDALNITDYAVLKDLDRELSISNQEEIDLSYPLDIDHGWEVSNIEVSVDEIKDTRNWINNSGLKPVQIFRKYQTFESAHLYDNVRTAYGNPEHTIFEDGAYYMRVHFVNMSFDYQTDASDSDFMVVYNGTYSEVFAASGFREDFFSPWAIGDTIYLSYEAINLGNRDYGYYIDYYEIINASSNFELNSINWQGSYEQSGSWGSNTYGFGNISSTDAMFIGYQGSYYDDLESYVFYEGSYTELNQENILIPRGKVVDAYLSFDYYTQFALDTNNIIMYMEINGEKVYSKGLLDLSSEGKNEWHQTGNVPMYLWTNQSNVFDPGVINNQDLNVSFGIRNAGSSTAYSGYEDGNANVIWFDNLTLSLTTIANATQDGINLTLNTFNFENRDVWGKALLNLTTIENTNPLILILNTTSPELSFELNATVYGFHKTITRYNQQYDQGISYKILKNGSILWEIYHNLYMPSDYEDFEILINKPLNWEFISVSDPFLQPRAFEGGNIGDNYIKVNMSNALFAGWYYLTASSPNYLNSGNTEVKVEEQWLDSGIFSTDDTIQIRTQVNYTGEIPTNLVSTEANLTIYNPDGDIWYEETQTPLSNGTVYFFEITLGSLNTTGGIYNYTIFWSNGTAIGGVESNFIVNHNSKLTLLKPDDPSGFVGDIFPVRVLLEDSENNLTISNSIISYNWTDGIRYFEEAASGIYETTLDSADLASRGVYTISINSSKIGFFDTNITLELNLGEETRLQRLESEYDIELHANSSLKFKFADFDGDGIDGATVLIGISNSSLYTINNTGDGIYYIEFSTLYINTIGTYELSINFSAPAYQPQYHRFQFEITKQSVDLDVLINDVEIYENSLHSAFFYENINISSRVISEIDEMLISGGKVSWLIGSYEQNLTETIYSWYNGSISCTPDYFILGINYVYLKFEHDNYKNQTFGFQVLVNQIELNVEPIGFEDTLNIDVGGSLQIQIRVLEPQTSDFIENATVSFSWEYGVGYLEEVSPGTYELNLNVPENLEGTFRFNIIVIKDIDTYKTTKFSFFLVIGQPNFPAFIIWIIIISLIIGVGILGTLSLRSYVILPRKRKKQSDLLSRTQRYKDMENIQAIVIIHKLSGIPLYSKSYSILEKQKKELFSGFIQAITTIGEEILGKKSEKAQDDDKIKSDTVERIIELDFKYFYCLICDRGELRVVLVLKNKASERIKEQAVNFSLGLMLQHSEQIENWDGSLDRFEQLIPPILNNYFELDYKEAFILNSAEYIAKVRDQNDMSKMEIRILNVIYSIAKNKQKFYLDQVLEIIHEEDKNKVIDGLESLLEKNIIINAKN